MALGDIYQKASLVQIPSGYKAADAELYSVVPNTTAGDFTVSVDADATRVNKDGLVESVAANQARLNYDPTNPQDPTLLLEPQRTNQISKSRDLEGWTDLNGSETTTNNDAVAPNGSNTAATIKKTGSDNSTLRFYTTHTNFSTVRSASVYIKKLSGNPTVSFGVTDTQVSITPTDEWVRYTKDNVTPTNFNVNIFVDIEVSGVSGDKIAVWGAQLEEGTYSTSLIETTGAVLTRTADNVHLLNQTFITNYPFTVYANAKIDAVGNAIFSLNNTSDSSYYLVFSLLSSSQVAVFRRNPSASNSDFWNFSYTVGDTIKVAVAFISATAYKLYINGTEIADRTSGSSIPFNHDDISLGQFRITGDTGTRNSVNEFMLFNEALTDAELTTLTT